MRRQGMIAWLLGLGLALCAAGACAQVQVIEDCGVCAGHVISGDDAVSVLSGVHQITLDRAVIDVSDRKDAAAFSIAPGAEVRLTLAGESTLVSGECCAGLQVPRGARLCITEDSEGGLTALGGAPAAGIGGGSGQDAGEIRILGGKVIARLRESCEYAPIGAGIGGGMESGFESILIRSGTVYADGWCGIGGNCGENEGRIEISGGEVYASGDGLWEIELAVERTDQAGAITVSGGTVYLLSSCGFATDDDDPVIHHMGGMMYFGKDM